MARTLLIGSLTLAAIGLVAQVPSVPPSQPSPQVDGSSLPMEPLTPLTTSPSAENPSPEVSSEGRAGCRVVATTALQVCRASDAGELGYHAALIAGPDTKAVSELLHKTRDQLSSALAALQTPQVANLIEAGKLLQHQERVRAMMGATDAIIQYCEIEYRQTPPFPGVPYERGEKIFIVKRNDGCEKYRDYLKEFDRHYRRAGNTLPREIVASCPEVRESLPILMLVEDDWTWDFPAVYLGAEAPCSQDRPAISNTLAMSPLTKAKLRPGDAILGLAGGVRFSGWRDVFMFLRTQAPGNKVSLEIQRGDKVIQKTVTLAKRPERTFYP